MERKYDTYSPCSHPNATTPCCMPPTIKFPILLVNARHLLWTCFQLVQHVGCYHRCQPITQELNERTCPIRPPPARPPRFTWHPCQTRPHRTWHRSKSN